MSKGGIRALCAFIGVTRARFGSERFSSSLWLVMDGLKDADGGDDGGGPVWAAAQFGQQPPAFEDGDGAFAECPVAGLVAVDQLLVAG
jgi:hypothetical protein